METKAIIELIDEAISLNLEAIKSVSKNIDNATVEAIKILTDNTIALAKLFE